MNINSNYSELELCEYMLTKMSDSILRELILENKGLRIKYGAFDKKNFKYEREKALNVATILSKSNKSLREEIINTWEIQSKFIYNKKESNIKTMEDAKKYIKEDSSTEDMLLLAMTLWRKTSSELNDYGDQIFKNCLTNKYRSKKETSIMNDTTNALSMNLSECIDAINNYHVRIKEYEEKLKSKDEIIKELREQLKLNGDPKEVKKEVTKLGKTIEKNSSELKNYNNDITKLIDMLKVEVIDIKKEVSKQSITINSNNKLLVNELSKIIKDFQNTITSSIIVENKKMFKTINESINTQLNIIRDNTIKTRVISKDTDKEEFMKITNTKGENKGNTRIQEFPPELDDLLGDI